MKPWFPAGFLLVLASSSLHACTSLSVQPTTPWPKGGQIPTSAQVKMIASMRIADVLVGNDHLRALVDIDRLGIPPLPDDTPNLIFDYIVYDNANYTSPVLYFVMWATPTHRTDIIPTRDCTLISMTQLPRYALKSYLDRKRVVDEAFIDIQSHNGDPALFQKYQKVMRDYYTLGRHPAPSPSNVPAR